MPANQVHPSHQVIGYLARRLQQVTLGVLTEVTQSEGLPGLQYAALASLDDMPGLTQKQMAESLGIDQASAVHLVDALEAKGFLERGIDPKDRRARHLFPTAAGKRKRRRVQPKMLAAQHRILKPLSSDERTTLLAWLTRIVEANEAYAKPGNGRKSPDRTKISTAGSREAR